ncbi:MAG: hypothetical protein ABIJ17_00715 [Patescibacteria group bacterium]
MDGGKIIYLVDNEKIRSLKFPTIWFEPTPQGKFMLSVAFGQAKYYTDNLNLALQENFTEMKNFLKKIGSNRRLAAGRLEIDFKKPFNLLAKLLAKARVAGQGEAEHSSNRLWWTRADSNR